MEAHRVIERCRTLAQCSETPDGLLRTFLSPAMRDAHRMLSGWMEAAGMRTRMDAAGNLRGVYPAAREGAPRLLIGSHIDTVIHAGAFDGVLGVALGIGLVESLAGRRLPFGIEVIAFSDEEGVRFSTPFLGSRALAGTLDAATLERRDAAGVTVADAIRNFGLWPEELAGTALHGEAFAYFELHIEQGPVLEALDLPLGVVTSIVGQSRFTVTFRGQANHAGTTPMALRRDALAAAARWIGIVERCARATPGLVATVGSIQAFPGAGNCVPGEVRASLDVRHAENEVRRSSACALLEAARRVAGRRGVSVDCRQQADQSAVSCDADLTAMLADAVATAGYPLHRMASGAGHDAMILAAHVPAAMLFLRSPGGLSHHPDESVRAGDVEAALRAGAALLATLEARDA